jgi:hypothetical protein
VDGREGNATSGTEGAMKKPDVEHQARFGTDGDMEIDEHTESDLSDWGIVEGEPERETRIEQEAASEWGVDDRTEVEQEQQTEQDTLVVERDDEQMTLGGDAGGMEVKYGD